MQFDIINTTANRTIGESGLTTNLQNSYSEKAFAGDFRFPIRRCFGSAGKNFAKAFSIGEFMPNHRKDAYAESLYQNLYVEKEMSLQDIAKHENKTRQSIYSLFKIRGYPLRKTQPLPHREFNGLKFTLRSHGYLARTDGNRELMHRYVWRFYHGRIPRGYDIHHKNHNKQDNRIENLELLRKADHTRKHHLQPVQIKYCRQCNRRIERHEGESPSAYDRRNFCDYPCSRQWAKGKPRGAKASDSH